MFHALVHPFTFTSRKLFSHFLDQISKLQLVRRALFCGGQSSMSLPLFSWVFMHCELPFVQSRDTAFPGPPALLPSQPFQLPT